MKYVILLLEKWESAFFPIGHSPQTEPDTAEPFSDHQNPDAGETGIPSPRFVGRKMKTVKKERKQP